MEYGYKIVSTDQGNVVLEFVNKSGKKEFVISLSLEEAKLLGKHLRMHVRMAEKR